MTYEKTINPDLSDDPKGIVIKFPITKSRPSRNGNDFRAGGGDHHHPPCGIGLKLHKISKISAHWQRDLT